MGLNKDEGRRVYLSITDGKLTRQHKNPVDKVTVSRVTKTGKTVHEEFFRSFTGKLKSIKSKEAPFGTVWECVMEDDGQEYMISWQYSSRYANNFFRALPNVDLSKEFKLAPWSMDDKLKPGKKVVGISLYQEGWKDGRVPFKYTKEEPGDHPQMKQVKKKGKMEWDDSEQLEFYEGMSKAINEHLKAAPAATTEPYVGPEIDEDNEPEDDLPF